MPPPIVRLFRIFQFGTTKVLIQHLKRNLINSVNSHELIYKCNKNDDCSDVIKNATKRAFCVIFEHSEFTSHSHRREL